MPILLCLQALRCSSILNQVNSYIFSISYPRRLCRSAWVGFSGQSVCLSVCPQHNSKTNESKVFKLGIGNDLRVRDTILGFKGQRSSSQGHMTRLTGVDKSRTKRPRNTKIGEMVTHPTGNNAYMFQGQRSKSHGR